MKLKDYAKREAAVLEWIYETRKRLGLGDPAFNPVILPVGRRRNSNSCPIARALRAGVNESSIWVTSTRYGEGLVPLGKELPSFVSLFIIDFDNGEFPWLEEK